MRKKAQPSGTADTRHDHRLTVIESTRAPDGYHTIVEAWAVHPPSVEHPSGAVFRFTMIVDETPAWIPFGALIGRESKTHMRVHQTERDPGYLVRLRGDIVEVTPMPATVGEPLAELVGGGPHDGMQFIGDEAVRFRRLKSDEAFCIQGALYTELLDQPDDNRRFVFVGMHTPQHGSPKP